MGQITLRQEWQSGMVGMATRLRKEQRMGQRGENPQSSKAQPLKGASQYRMENQKTIYAIRGQG